MEGCASNTLSSKVDPDLGVPTIKIGTSEVFCPMSTIVSKRFLVKTRFTC